MVAALEAALGAGATGGFFSRILFALAEVALAESMAALTTAGVGVFAFAAFLALHVDSCLSPRPSKTAQLDPKAKPRRSRQIGRVWK